MLLRGCLEASHLVLECQEDAARGAGTKAPARACSCEVGGTSSLVEAATERASTVGGRSLLGLGSLPAQVHEASQGQSRRTDRAAPPDGPGSRGRHGLGAG